MLTTAETTVSGHSLRTELKRVTRERLVGAAMRLFEAQGFRVTSVAQIAQAAGTTTPTFYRYFKSKSDLMSVIEQHLAVKVEGVMLLLDKIKNPTRGNLSNWINQYAAMWKQVHRLCDAYWEATTTDPELASQSVPTTYRLTSLMKNSLSNLGPKQRARFHARLVIVSLLMDKFMYILKSTEGTAMRQLIFNEFSDMLWLLLFDGNKLARSYLKPV